MAKFDFLETILYLSLAVIFLWALGKAIGLIQTPAWLEVLPFIVIPFAAGAGYQKIKSLLDSIIKKVDEIGKETKNIEKRLTFVEIEHTMLFKSKKNVA